MGISPEKIEKGTHYEQSGVCTVKGMMETIKEGVILSEGQENIGSSRVYNECSLNIVRLNRGKGILKPAGGWD